MIYNWSEALGSSNDDLFYMIYTWSEAFCSTNDDLFYMIYTWSEALVLREVRSPPIKRMQPLARSHLVPLPLPLFQLLMLLMLFQSFVQSLLQACGIIHLLLGNFQISFRMTLIIKLNWYCSITKYLPILLGWHNYRGSWWWWCGRWIPVRGHWNC